MVISVAGWQWRGKAFWTWSAARAAVLASAAPADNTHRDQLLSARSSVTRLIAMSWTLWQPGCCLISASARRRKSCMESRGFAIPGAALLRSDGDLVLQVAGLVIAPELAQRRLIQLKQHLAQFLGFRIAGREILSVNFTQRPD